MNPYIVKINNGITRCNEDDSRNDVFACGFKFRIFELVQERDKKSKENLA